MMMYKEKQTRSLKQWQRCLLSRRVNVIKFLFFPDSIRYVLNVTKEIDNFFPRDFTYYNVRVFDSDFEDLLKHWDETNRFIAKAK